MRERERERDKKTIVFNWLETVVELGFQFGGQTHRATLEAQSFIFWSPIQFFNWFLTLHSQKALNFINKT